MRIGCRRLTGYACFLVIFFSTSLAARDPKKEDRAAIEARYRQWTSELAEGYVAEHDVPQIPGSMPFRNRAQRFANNLLAKYGASQLEKLARKAQGSGRSLPDLQRAV